MGTPAFVGTDSPALKNTKHPPNNVKEIKDSDTCNFDLSDGSYIVDPEPGKRQVLENLQIRNEPSNINNDTCDMGSVTNTPNNIYRKNGATVNMEISRNQSCNNDTF